MFLLALFTFVECDKTEPVSLSTLSGKVTFTNAAGTVANASGAVVNLEKVSSGTIVSTVANGTGDYSFENLKAGSYKLTSSYYTENKNVAAARLDGLNFATASAVSVSMGSASLTQDLTLVSVGQAGTGIEALSANYQWDPNFIDPATQTPKPSYQNTGIWTYDATHSPVTFEFAYRGNEADFSGTFSQASKFNVSVDPANLAAASIDVEIDLTSVDTRSPGGRDPRLDNMDQPLFSPTAMFTELGCIMGTFLINVDDTTKALSDAAPQMISVDAADRYAKFTSTNVSAYGDGFVAKGNLVFHRRTKPVELWFKIVPKWYDASNKRYYSGFEGKFLMNAKTDFGIVSSSVNDAIIKIYISTVLYKL